MFGNISILLFCDLQFVDNNGLSYFRRCFHIFLKAVKVVPTEKMWFHYIDAFFELLKSNPDKHEFINKFLLKLLPHSNVQNLLKEQHYLCWVSTAINQAYVQKLFIEST